MPGFKHPLFRLLFDRENGKPRGFGFAGTLSFSLSLKTSLDILFAEYAGMTVIPSRCDNICYSNFNLNTFPLLREF